MKLVFVIRPRNSCSAGIAVLSQQQRYKFEEISAIIKTPSQRMRLPLKLNTTLYLEVLSSSHGGYFHLSLPQQIDKLVRKVR